MADRPEVKSAAVPAGSTVPLDHIAHDGHIARSRNTPDRGCIDGIGYIHDDYVGTEFFEYLGQPCFRVSHFSEDQERACREAGIRDSLNEDGLVRDAVIAVPAVGARVLPSGIDCRSWDAHHFRSRCDQAIREKPNPGGGGSLEGIGEVASDQNTQVINPRKPRSCSGLRKADRASSEKDPAAISAPRVFVVKP